MSNLARRFLKGQIRPLDRLAQSLPARLAAQLDLRRPHLYQTEGGPMNGQAGRRKILRELVRTIEFQHVIETGTHRGTTTEFLSAITGVTVASVELDDRYRRFAETRLASNPDVQISGGDSRDFLRRQSTTSDAVTLFYLDAHWLDDLPLAEELKIIAGSWSKAVVVVDDFQVPDDAGYAYDDYGPGKALVPAYLPDEIGSWAVFYPAIGSVSETGARCGSAFLASPDLSEIVGKVRTLRRAPTTPPTGAAPSSV
ncbi:hypothetical protein [Streptomyces sp. CB02460]|uniref:hypothetical protein n=1 Tax=Streptomyces sp. CB02460 TaxID=1703941 RepID=UPI0009397E67|nr:hypothetical protein [Streptomyces sp. CB02460]OKJ78314.1 hypothetical protein AMK30_04765 [Streptomyces sp. CB02460]